MQSTPSLMQQALGTDWDKLPPALQAHYQRGNNTDTGHLDIEFPAFMRLPLRGLRLLGALVHRNGECIPTTVNKHMEGDCQRWQRSITFPDGQVIYFKSFWIAAGEQEKNQLIEFVNPFLGLQMAVSVHDEKLHYQGVRFVLQIGKLRLPIPEWLALGHTDIIETAIDENHFDMDFRLTHPLLGQIFRYAGRFNASPCPAQNR